MNKELGLYPDTTDADFYKLLTEKKELADLKRKRELMCLQPHQKLLANFLNPKSQYNSVLVYHSLGAGKTLTSIAIAENFKKDYKIIVALKNANLISNYRLELLNSICSVYNKEIQSAKESDKQEICKLVLKKINKVYTFYTYNELVSKVIGSRIHDVSLLQKSKVKYKKVVAPFKLKDVVLIIDEIHNITENKSFSVFLDLLRTSVNTKLVLMSATPMYDNITEIFEINNLLNFDTPNNSIRSDANSLLKAGMIAKHKQYKDTVLNDTSYTLTSLGEKILIKTLKGRISYLAETSGSSGPSLSKYAKKIYRGVSLNGDKSIKIYKSYMSDFQRDVYTKTLESSDSDNFLFKNSTNASIIVYPNKEYGVPGFLSNKKDLRFLDKKNLQKYSCKLYSMLDEIQKCKGLVFIYSNLVNNGGIEIVRLMLKRNGFSKYRYRGGIQQNTFTILKGGVSSSKLADILNVFNSDSNKHGERIKIVIGSPVVSEGLTFKNIRQIHILEPSWNMSKIDQIVGRGVRYMSHNSLPPEERVVEVFLHAAIARNGKTKTTTKTKPKKVESIDFLKYRLSEQKDVAIKNVEYLLRKISIDCVFNKPARNPGVDGSRECLYKKCEYSCVYEPKSKSKTLNVDTFSLKDHLMEEYMFIVEQTIELFKLGFAYNVDYIVNYILKKQPVVDPENMYYVLHKLTTNPYFFLYNKNGKKSRLVIAGDVIIAQPDSEKYDEPFYYKVVGTPAPVTLKKKSKKTHKTKNKIVLKTLNAAIYGSMLNKHAVNDNVFRVIHNRNFMVEDKRSFTNGKECKFYSKGELLDISKKLGIPLENSFNKEQLCKGIYKDLVSKGLVLV